MFNDAMPLSGVLLGQVVPIALGAAILIFAALTDVAARTIPNWTSAALALIGAALRWADGQLLVGLAVGLAVFVVCTLCWHRGWLGGGDVKLLTAAAIFVPPGHVGAMLTSTMLAGGIVALVYLAARLIMSRHAAPAPRPPAAHRLARILRTERWRLRRGGPLPYASAIAAGTIFVTMSGLRS